MRRETVAPPASLASDERGILGDTEISSEQLIALAEQKGKQGPQRFFPALGAKSERLEVAPKRRTKVQKSSRQHALVRF